MSPETVAVVAGGDPEMIVGLCAVEPAYGVIAYCVGGPPVVGADQETVADPGPAVAVTLLAGPGGAAGVNETSTQ